MRKLALGMTFVAGVLATTGSALFACGSSHESEFDGGAGDTGVIGTIPPGDDDDGGGFGTDGGGLKVGTQGDGGCQGLQCAIATSCGDGGSTTITGSVLDPAGTEPIYNAVVYVPMYNPADGGAPAGDAIQPIQGGINFPSGVSCDSCGYLFTGNPVAVATTQPDGTFVIPNAPSGANIPVVVQIGKWRTHTTVASVPSCGTASAGAIQLPAKIDPTDPIESMPQFGLSMGGSDSLECLLYRMGIDLSEFTAGPGGTGHVHLFTGYGMKAPDGGAPPAPPGYEKMWDSLADLEKYDVTVFSCEGRETTNADPQILEQYVNAGGRAFTSHYHYAWFTGPIDTYQTNAKSPQTGAGTTTYTPNADWSTLASWDTDDPGVSASDTIGVKVDTSLNGADAGPFLKGEALTKWLTKVDAFGQNGVPADEVPIIGPAFDPAVTSANPYSQEWAGYDANSLNTHGNDNNGHQQLAGSYPTAYFSFNTPVDAVTPDDGGTAPYCGRVVFTGLHVGAAAKDTTTSNGTQLPSASTCNPTPGHLSPQEKLLEFILFDLSSCVTPDTAGATSPIMPIR